MNRNGWKQRKHGKENKRMGGRGAGRRLPLEERFENKLSISVAEITRDTHTVPMILFIDLST